jgi:hypothetical protein
VIAGSITLLNPLPGSLPAIAFRVAAGLNYGLNQFLNYGLKQL